MAHIHISGMIRVSGCDTGAMYDKHLKKLYEKFPDMPAGLLGGVDLVDGVDCVVLPRGFTQKALRLPPASFDDQRVYGNVVDVHVDESKLDEREKFQRAAIAKALQFPEGIIVSPTGSGKTIIAVLVIGELRRTTLIVTHRSTIAKQLREAIKTVLGFESGFIGDSERNIQPITVGMIQSIRSNDEILKKVGLLIIDEAHHITASSYLALLRSCPAGNRYGLTATTRKPAEQKIITAAIGPVLVEIPLGKLQDEGHINKGFVRPIYTGAIATKTDYVHGRCWYYKSMQEDPEKRSCPNPCTYPDDDDIENCVYSRGYYTWAYKQLSADVIRNQLIASNVERVVPEHPFIITLTHLKVHVHMLVELFEPFGKIHVATGSPMRPKDRDAAIESYCDQGGILIATTGCVGEGFNAPKTSCLVRAMPSGGRIAVRQQTGRVMRPQDNPSLILDFVDMRIPWLKGMWMARLSIYKALGFKLEAKTTTPDLFT